MRTFKANAGIVTEIDGRFTFVFNPADHARIAQRLPGEAIPESLEITPFCNPTPPFLPTFDLFFWPGRGVCWNTGPRRIPRRWQTAWRGGRI